MATYRKFIIIALVCLAVLAIVSMTGGEHAAPARHFMRTLVHHLF